MNGVPINLKPTIARCEELVHKEIDRVDADGVDGPLPLLVRCHDTGGEVEGDVLEIEEKGLTLGEATPGIKTTEIRIPIKFTSSFW